MKVNASVTSCVKDSRACHNIGKILWFPLANEFVGQRGTVVQTSAAHARSHFCPPSNASFSSAEFSSDLTMPSNTPLSFLATPCATIHTWKGS
eukprot:486176-Amphidinium_carterae.1